MLLDGIAAFFFLFKFQFSHFVAVIRAHFSFYAHFAKMKKKRKVSDHHLKYYKRFSIVLDQIFK
jgi:hypothetical protein